MTAAFRIAAALAVVLAMGPGCTPSENEKAETRNAACSMPPLQDVTHVWVSPRDMTTHVGRELYWDDATHEVAFGQADLEIRFHNPARAPSQSEIEDVLSRTELLAWPAGETIPYVAEPTTSRGRGSATVKVRSDRVLEDGWYALRIAGRAAFVADETNTSDRELGQDQISRFHVGSCPLVLGVESLGDSGITRVVLSEILDASSLRSLGLVSPDGVRTCRPRFSTDGLLSPGKKLDFECDFAPTEMGVRIVRDGSSGIVLPKGPRIGAAAFRETRGSLKTSRLAPSFTEAMPDCTP